jgi:hypothetical protein
VGEASRAGTGVKHRAARQLLFFAGQQRGGSMTFQLTELTLGSMSQVLFLRAGAVFNVRALCGGQECSW